MPPSPNQGRSRMGIVAPPPAGFRGLLRSRGVAMASAACFAVVAVFPAAEAAPGSASADYALPFHAFTGGGGSAASADYSLLASFGSPAGPAASTDGSTTLAAGFVPLSTAVIAGRWLFYNQSVWDGNSAAAEPADDAAIATDKRPLMPGGLAGFANYSSYSRGLNGLMIDVAELASIPGPADLAFAMGRDIHPSAWPAAPAPSMAVRWGAGAGGSDRVTLTWSSGTVRQTWLRTMVRANDATGLGAADVFYFGNAVGETGNDPDSAQVSAADSLRILANIRSSTSVTDPFDINRDGRVAAADRLQVLGNLSGIDPLPLLDLGSFPGSLAAVPAMAGGPWAAEAWLDSRRGGLTVRGVSDGHPVRVWTATGAAGAAWEVYERVGAGVPPGGMIELYLPIDRADAARVYHLERERPVGDASFRSRSVNP